MPPTDATTTRRTVLRTTAATAAAATSLAGVAAASDFEAGDCVVADGSDGYAPVFDSCGDDVYDDRVENGETGTVREVCRTPEGDEYADVAWDDARPDGWVLEGDLAHCVSTT
jgi:nitrous oxide reductase